MVTEKTSLTESFNVILVLKGAHIKLQGNLGKNLDLRGKQRKSSSQSSCSETEY